MSDLSAWPTEDEVLEKFSAKERLAVRRMLAEVRRRAAEEALLKAEDAVSELFDVYKSTADEMRGRSECVDSNRYSNYAAGLSMAAGSIRTLAAEYRKEETE